MSVMLRALFAAFLLLPLAVAPAGATEKHQLALQISDNDPAKMNAVLNVAANVSNIIPTRATKLRSRSSPSMPACTCCATTPRR